MQSGYPNTVVLRQVKKALEDLLEEKVCLTEGVRNVAQWGWSNHGLDELLFRPFIGVDSETDRFPVGRIRDLWNADRLQEIDSERIAIETHYRRWIVESTTNLLDAVVATLPRSTFTDPDPT
ncbi:hypothetical protein [Dyella tabacisoli]|uniref:hypothetical protein n=1 Tax=Dyella tabacisoli TaxID=2282381 RepID=UPI0013B3BC7F|nr:hypothetical protein [Dyella tabacisoli]